MRHVAKLAVAFVVEQAVAVERGDVDVVAAVVVVVGHRHADAVHLDIEAAARGDIGERAVVVVAIERGVAMCVPAAVKSLLLISRISAQPSPSKSKKAQPEPIVSGSYFLPGAPAVVTNWIPAAAVTSVK